MGLGRDTSAADAVDDLFQRKDRNRRGGRPDTETVVPEPAAFEEAATSPTTQQKLQLIEAELRAAQEQRQRLEEKVVGAEIRFVAMEQRLRAEITHVAQELAALTAKLDAEQDSLSEHVRALRAQVDDLSRRIARRPIRRVWETELSFTFLAL